MSQKIIPILLFTFLLVSTSSCTDEEIKQKPETVETEELPSDGIKIINAWARPGQSGGVSAIYMDILNGSAQPDTVRSVSLPIVGMAGIHESFEQEEGIMGMRPADTVVVPARDALLLKPGGLHIMLMQLTHELAEGDSVELTVEFSNAGEMTLSVPVQSMNR